MRSKVVVIGGGVAGLSVALFASRRSDPLRSPVVLLERSEPDRGSSGRTSALLWRQDSERALCGIARDALRFYAAFQQHTGRGIGFRRVGVMTLDGRGDQVRVRLEAERERLAAMGIAVELLGAEQIRRRVEGIEVAGDEYALWDGQGGFIDVRRTFEALSALAKNGGTVVRPGADHARIVVEGGRVVAVETSRERIEAESVVVASGPWSAGTLAAIGVELPLVTRRVREHRFASPCVGPDHENSLADEDLGGPEASGATSYIAGAFDPLRLATELERRFQDAPDDGRPAQPVLFDRLNDFVAYCDPGRGRTHVRRLKECGEGVASLDREPEPVEDEFRRWAREALSGRMPIFADLADLESRAGWTTWGADGRPLVGPVEEVEGLFVATGLGDDAFRLAPGIGEGLAQALTGEPVGAYDPDYFAPSRFSREAT